MKNLLIIISLCLFCQLSLSQVYAAPGVTPKTETVKEVLQAVDSTLKDTAAVKEITTTVETAIEEMPSEGSAWWKWFLWVLTPLYIIAGIVASHMKTKKSYWWLRGLPLLVKFVKWIFENFVDPKNKRVDGGNHSI